MQCPNANQSTIREPRRDPRSGQILIVFVVVFALIAGSVALMLDGGRVYWEKRMAQNAADAAAMAGGHELRRGNDLYSGDVKGWIKQDAVLHGFKDSEITVEYPPLRGSNVGNTNFVGVEVSRDVPLSFMRMFGWPTANVKAWATAGLQAGGEACIIALNNDSTRDAFKVNGTPNLTANCGIMVNSTNSNAMRNVGSGSITASWVGVTGGYSGGGSISPSPTTSVPPILDPLAELPVPSAGSLPAGTSYNAASSNAFGGFVGAAKGGVPGPPGGGGGGGGGSGGGGGGGGGSSGGTTTYYTPGVHNGAIKITGGTHHFNPGNYYLQKGMKITGGTITGTDVFFYNVNASGKDTIDIGGNASVQLSAPTSGTYKGILFFTDRNSPKRNPGNKIARGTADSFFEGALYFPSQDLNWAGNPSNYAKWALVIADTLQISGTSDNQVIGPPSLSQAPPAYTAVLFE